MSNHKGRYAAPRTRNPLYILAALAAVGMLLLAGACANTEAEADEPVPSVTVTADPEVITETVTETETVEVEVEVVPQACLDALEQGERLSDALGWTLDWVGEYLGAVADLDVVLMENLTGDLTSQTDSGAFTGVFPDFEAAAQKCRAES